jgi:hypothetical protein
MRWFRMAESDDMGMEDPIDKEEVDLVKAEPGEKAAPMPAPQQQQQQPIDRNKMSVELQNRMRGVMPGTIINRNKGILNSPDYYRLNKDMAESHWYGTSNPKKMETRLNKPEPLPPFKNDTKKPLVETKPKPPQPTKATSPNAKQPGPVAPAWQAKQKQPNKKADWVSRNCRFAASE